MSFQKLFLLSKYHMFWLSYESLSICLIFFIKKESFPAKTVVFKYIRFIVKCFLSSQYFQIPFMQGSLVIVTTTDDC